MNNKEFINALALRDNQNIKDTRQLVEALVSVISEALDNGDAICIQNFGTFEVKKKNERIIVNPTTKQRQLVPPKLVVGFKPSAALKDKL